MKSYGIFNLTKNKWLLDEDFQVVVCYNLSEAKEELAAINDIKTINPRCKDYEYEIREDPDLSQSVDLTSYT